MIAPCSPKLVRGCNPLIESPNSIAVILGFEQITHKLLSGTSEAAPAGSVVEDRTSFPGDQTKLVCRP